MPRRAPPIACAFVALVACSLAPGPARGDDAEGGPDEVIVRGNKAPPAVDPGGASVGRSEARQLPGAFGDPWRAIESTPGFTPVLSGLPYFYVRGAPPGNVGYYFDGVRVPYLFHFGLGPAVVQPSLIAHTDVYEGGYPASLGRWAGGIVDATAMPPEGRLRGEGGIRAIDAGGLLEVPLANGRGSVLAGGRYSYTAALFSLLASDVTLDYRDYQTRVTYALSDRDTISLLVFGAYDYASQKQFADATALAASTGSNDPSNFQGGLIERVLFASEFHRADVRLDHDLADGGKARVAATVGFDRTRIEARREADDFMAGTRASLVQPLSRAVTLRVGGDVTVDRYGGDALPQFADDDDVVARQRYVFADRTDYAAGAWIDAVLAPFEWVDVTPGVRVDAFGSGPAHALAVDPRLSTKITVSRGVRIFHAYGVASQPPSTPVALPGITIANLEGGLQRSIQTSAGVEADLPEDFTGTLSVFHDAFYGLNDALGTAQTEIQDIERSDAVLQKSRGSAYGIELGARRKLSRRLTGLASYTLSRSIRTANNQDFVSSYDRTHVASLVASYDLGRSWRAGGRLIFYTGVPVTPPEPAFVGQVTGTPPERTPPFERLDLRLEKRWRLGEHGWAAFVVEALNATLSREVTGYRCGRALVLPGEPIPVPPCAERVVGPISVPSIGIEGGF